MRSQEHQVAYDKEIAKVVEQKLDEEAWKEAIEEVPAHVGHSPCIKGILYRYSEIFVFDAMLRFRLPCNSTFIQRFNYSGTLLDVHDFVAERLHKDPFD